MFCAFDVGGRGRRRFRLFAALANVQAGQKVAGSALVGCHCRPSPCDQPAELSGAGQPRHFDLFRQGGLLTTRALACSMRCWKRPGVGSPSGPSLGLDDRCWALSITATAPMSVDAGHSGSRR